MKKYNDLDFKTRGQSRPEMSQDEKHNDLDFETRGKVTSSVRE